MRKFKKCLITGVTGSCGSYLAEHIYKKNKKIQIHGIYRSKGYLEVLKKNIDQKQLFLKKIDLQKFDFLKKYLFKIKPDVIFHVASNADVRDSFENPIKFVKNNNIITTNLLEAIRQAKLQSLVIICSSSEVYGNVPKNKQPISEFEKMNPINPYAATKAFQDMISSIYFKCFDLKIIITRMFSYTNARRTNLFQSAFALQIAKIEKNKQKILKHGYLGSKRTFVDIYDAMEAYWLTALKGKIGEIYNIGGNKVISVKKFLSILIKNSTTKIKTRLDKKLIRPKDLILQRVNCKKFIKHTGWKPKVTFQSSVAKLLEECRKRA